MKIPLTKFSTFSGPFGGVRCTVALRSFLGELGLVILPSTVAIPSIQTSGITETGTVMNLKPTLD